jgi:hypothetical protein
MGCYFTHDKDEGERGTGRYVEFAVSVEKKGKHKYK